MSLLPGSPGTRSHQLLSNVRFGCSFLLLILHQRIDDLTKFRARLREAYVRSASGSAPSTPEAIGPENDRMKMLEEIRAESVDICLVQARAHVHFLKVGPRSGSVWVLCGC